MRLPGMTTALLLALLSFDAVAAERWYSQPVVDIGDRLFQQHCAVCHGSEAEGTREWKKTDANGNYPPPPLDGTAHAWHHSIPQLARQIHDGGIRLGGVMPPFGEQLAEHEILAVIAYFQSKWPDELYDKWHQRFMQ